MPGLDFDLNLEAPESGQMNPIDWDDIVVFDGPAHELDYDMVWNDGIQGAFSVRFLFSQAFLLSMIWLFSFSVFFYSYQAGDGDVHASVADGDVHGAAANAVQGEVFSHGDFQFSVWFLLEISVNVSVMIPFFFFGSLFHVMVDVDGWTEGV